MAKITFIQPDGSEQVVAGDPGMTVMETAKKNLVAGIEAECGGACSCATCHVYVDDAWRDKVGPPSEMEEDMLDFAFDVRPSSRSELPDQGHRGPRRPDPESAREAVLADRCDPQRSGLLDRRKVGKVSSAEDGQNRG